LVNLVTNELPPESQKEKQTIELIENMLEEVEMTLKATNFHKGSKHGNLQGEEEEQLCSICYS